MTNLIFKCYKFKEVPHQLPIVRSKNIFEYIVTPLQLLSFYAMVYNVGYICLKHAL